MVPASAADAAALLARYQRDAAAAGADPEAFWAEQARALEWATPFGKVFDGSKAPMFRWFEGGKLNLVASAVDRHAGGPRADKAAFVWLSEDLQTRESITYRQLRDRVVKAAAALRALGVGKGDTVVIYMALTVDAVVAMLACARIGAVHSVVYAGLAAASLRARIEDAKAVLVLVSDLTMRRGKPVQLGIIADEALSEGCATVRDVALLRRDPASPRLRAPGKRHHDWAELISAAPSAAPLEIVDAEHPLFILYTSGTTGRPKGVLHVHGGYGAGVAYHLRTFFNVGEDEVFWCTSDIGWIVGHSYIVYAPLIAGITTVFREGALDFPSISVAYDVIAREKVNVLFTAPTAIRFWMKHGEGFAAGRNLQSLRWLTVAGEPLNPEAWHWAHRVLCGAGTGKPWGDIGDNWWQTETGGPAIGTPPGAPAQPGTAGMPLPGVSARVININGDDTTAGQPGALYLTRPFPHFFRTVYGDDERFVSSWDSIGYRTGDAAVREENGYIRIIGRTDDVIKVAGHRIGSAEIESALVAHPLVAEAAAIGLPDDLKGEKIAVFVTLRAGAEAPADPLATFNDHVRSTVGALASLSQVKVVAALPKTRSGKIMRRLLRARELGQDEGDLSTLDA